MTSKGPYRLPSRPAAAAPVATPFVFLEGIFLVGTPAPIVFMDNDVCARRIGEVIVSMPADMIRADDLGGCANGGNRQESCACSYADKRFFQQLHLFSFGYHCPRHNEAGKFPFRRSHR